MSSWPDPLDDAAAAATWRGAWSTLGLTPPAGERERLEAAWSGPGRAYHALEHLRECLAWWLRWRDAASHPAEVALALWYHDAVYDARSHDNEARSAAWARDVVGNSAVDLAAGMVTHRHPGPSAAADRVHGLVMATCHRAPAVGPDAQLLVDIDLAILGSPPARFARYDADVRREYAWVPEDVYRARRVEVLSQFLAMPRLYHGERAHALLEDAARRNLATAIRALR